MPVTQDVHGVFFLSEAIENHVRPRNQFANAVTFRIWRTDEWKILQYRNPVNQCVAHAYGGVWVVFGDETNGGFQVRDGLRRKDYFAAHELTRLRTSSTETPLPASMSRVASSSERNRRSCSWADISGSAWELSQICKAFRSVLGNWATAS